jgi:ABC-type multidrug transport system fused ATPase/permease subunit
MEDEREIVTQVSGYLDEEGVELKRFKSCLKWVCLDQSNIWRACLSWFIFSIFTIGVPLASHFALSCSSCDDNHSRPYRAVVQSSLSIFATLSFVCLSRWARQYGLRRFLFLDKLCDASEKVQRGYAEQLQVHFSSSFLFFQSCFLDSLSVCASFESIILHIGTKGKNVELRNPLYISFSFIFSCECEYNF